MRIAIDISSVLYGTGVSRYTEELVRNLLKIDKKNEYVLFGGSLRRLPELEAFTSTLKGNFSTKLISFPPTLADIVWNKFHTYPIEKMVGRADVFHSSDWTQPPTNAFKVTTIHDLAPIKFPQSTHPKIVAVHKRRLVWVKKEVDRVIVPSNATKKDVVEYGIGGKRIVVIPEAVPILPRVNVKKGNYVLAIGVNPRKNTQKIIDAAKKMGIKLVLVGEPTYMEVKEESGIKLVGRVSDVGLAELIVGARVLVYPSLYEGFGLPILEAFSLGTPVVTSNISSMPEVAGSAAVLVSPENVDEIAEGIKVAIKDGARLITAGLARAKLFSWQKTAQETLKVYEQAKGCELKRPGL